MQTLDFEAIKKILPHRYPFLLVDRILDIEPGKRAVGIKNVTGNEPFFQGHFPLQAIMPGVLIVEVMAQVGGVMMLAVEENRGKLAVLGGIDNTKFRRPIIPGDTLEVVTELVRARSNIGKVFCTARVDGQIVAEAAITFALVKPEEVAPLAKHA